MSFIRLMAIVYVLSAVWTVRPSLAWAAKETAASREGEPTSLREMIDQGVNQYEVYASAEATEPAEPRVAMRWANNARGSEDGITILYIYQGRPLAAACLYPWAGELVHDFQSMSRDKIVARFEGAIVWQPQESPFKFADIADAPAPAETPAQRLRQMKKLAEEFQSTMVGWKADNTDREELRLLSRPLFRYEPNEGAVVDGAVFAFVMGTDPESLLLIEAVRQDSSPVWKYAFVRRTSGELDGRHRGTVVWTAARYPPSGDPTQPGYSLRRPIPPELLPTAEGQ